MKGRLPEDTVYRDTGCEVSPSCLRCPLDRCVYDEPDARDVELLLRQLQVQQQLSEGESIVAIADAMGRSKRMVYRYLRGRA